MTAGLALVTGGSAGIGKGLVLALAQAGYRVAFSHLGALEEAWHLAAGFDQVRGFQADAGDAAEVARFHAAAQDWAGAAPRLLVNNAGIQTWAPLMELDPAAWERVIRINLTGTFLNTQAAARAMTAAGQGGSIVNIGSGCNKLAFPGLVDYTASKGGVEQFTKSAAIELGPQGITVNCVAPGAILTERTAAEAPDYEATWARMAPVGRVGRPEDIAAAVLFFASPAASFITGQTLWVDGGAFTRAPWPYQAA